MIATFQLNISQHCWVQHVACVWPPCCDLLRHVGCCWLKFENGQVFHAAFLDVASCCSSLARFVQQCCAWACALDRFSTRNIITCRNTLQQGGETRATCCTQQCCHLSSSNVAIVWPEFANPRPTMLGCVAL